MLKSKIEVGDLVEIDLKTGLEPFLGEVLATNPPIGADQFNWYRVKPANPNDMPGTFWYKEPEVKKVKEESE